MNQEHDRELNQWTSDWQAGDELPTSSDAIRQYVQGRDRVLWGWALSEVAIGGVALPVLVYLGWAATDVIERASMWLLAFITVAAVAVGCWNWRGTLLHSARTTAEFVAVSAERLHRLRQAWRLGWLVLAAEVLVFSVWIASRASPPWAWGWLVLVSLSAVAFLVWTGQWIRRDAGRFESLKRELTE